MNNLCLMHWCYSIINRFIFISNSIDIFFWKINFKRLTRTERRQDRKKTLPKAQRTRGLSSSCQSNFFYFRTAFANYFQKLWRTAYTTFLNLFTAFSSYCDNINQLVSFIAIKSTKQSTKQESVSESVSELVTGSQHKIRLKFTKRQWVSEWVSESVSQWVS